MMYGCVMGPIIIIIVIRRNIYDWDVWPPISFTNNNVAH